MIKGLDVENCNVSGVRNSVLLENNTIGELELELGQVLKLTGMDVVRCSGEAVRLKRETFVSESSEMN